VISIIYWYMPRFVCNFCMMLTMVKEADLDRIGVPEDYEVLDAQLSSGGWASSATRCSPISPEGTSAAYLALTACLPWDLSGTRKASESGKRRKRIGRVVGSSANSESEKRREG
jgi:hypothetical protein